MKSRLVALKSVAQTIKPSSFLDYRPWLEEIYKLTKQQLEAYSYVHFAEDLGFGKTNTLHLIIRGKRPLTSKAADKIIAVLEIRGLERQFLESIVRYNNSRKPIERDVLFEKIKTLKSRTLTDVVEKTQLEYFSEWYHPVIRELVALPDFNPDPQWLASKVQPRILPEQARKSFELLLKLDLVRKDAETGKYVLTTPWLEASPPVQHLGFVSYHEKVIELARESLTSIHHSHRTIEAMNFLISEESFEKVRLEIEAFCEKIRGMVQEDGKPTTVYQMNVQLFPFSK